MKFNNPLQLQGPQPGRLSNLGQFVFGGSTSYSRNITADAAYTAFFIVVNISAGSALWAAKVSASPIGNASWSYSGAFSFKQNLGGRVILGSAANPGDILTFQIFFGAVSSGNFTVYGLTNYAPNNIRPDGLNYPIGALSSTLTTASGGAGTVVAAPSPGFSVLIKSLTAGGSAGGPQIDVTVEGKVIHLLRYIGTTSQLFAIPVPPDGLLLDNNTAINVPGIAGSVQTADIIYDIVPSA